MKLLAEIFRVPGLNPASPTLYREAVRGVIHREGKLLMVHVRQNDTYKFPGGGIERGETHHQALAREIREECGLYVREVGPAFGKVIEYCPAQESEYAIFKMTSYYYFCQTNFDFFSQTLDVYEQEMGFEPIWLSIEEALQRNTAFAASDPNRLLNWNPREIRVLELLQGSNVLA